ncbi:hypothetical protein Efla_002453 [Eimeria flavescens]
MSRIELHRAAACGIVAIAVQVMRVCVKKPRQLVVFRVSRHRCFELASLLCGPRGCGWTQRLWQVIAQGLKRKNLTKWSAAFGVGFGGFYGSAAVNSASGVEPASYVLNAVSCSLTGVRKPLTLLGMKCIELCRGSQESLSGTADSARQLAGRLVLFELNIEFRCWLWRNLHNIASLVWDPEAKPGVRVVSAVDVDASLTETLPQLGGNCIVKFSAGVNDCVIASSPDASSAIRRRRRFYLRRERSCRPDCSALNSCVSVDVALADRPRGVNANACTTPVVMMAWQPCVKRTPTSSHNIKSLLSFQFQDLSSLNSINTSMLAHHIPVLEEGSIRNESFTVICDA